MALPRHPLAILSCLALAGSAIIGAAAPAHAMGHEGATMTLKVNGTTVPGLGSTSIPTGTKSTFEFSVVDKDGKALDGPFTFTITDTDSGLEYFKHEEELKGGKTTFTWTSTLKADQKVEGFWTFHTADWALWNNYPVTLVGRAANDKDLSQETWPAAGVKHTKHATVKVKKGKKATIKPKVAATGSAVIVSKKLAVKQVAPKKKTVAKNKASAKVGPGTYKVTTTVTYRPTKQETVPTATQVSAGTRVPARCTFSSIVTPIDPWGRPGVRTLNGLSCAGNDFDKVDIGDMRETGVGTDSFTGNGFAITITGVVGAAPYQQLVVQLTAASVLTKATGGTTTVTRQGPLMTSTKTQTLKVKVKK